MPPTQEVEPQLGCTCKGDLVGLSLLLGFPEISKVEARGIGFYRDTASSAQRDTVSSGLGDLILGQRNFCPSYTRLVCADQNEGLWHQCLGTGWWQLWGTQRLGMFGHPLGHPSFRVRFFMPSCITGT